MKQALGLVEIQGLPTAVVVADTMAKAANIRILEIENTKGLGYMTIKIAGDVGAVNAAVNAGRQVGLLHDKLVSWKVIPRPSDYVGKTFCSPDPPEPGTKKTEPADQEIVTPLEEVKAEKPKTEAEKIKPEPVEAAMELLKAAKELVKASEQSVKEVEEPVAAAEEPVVVAEESVKAAEEPVKEAEEPVAAVEEPDQTLPVKAPAAKKTSTPKNKK